jgi:hypothetical protein
MLMLFCQRDFLPVAMSIRMRVYCVYNHTYTETYVTMTGISCLVHLADYSLSWGGLMTG